MKNNNYIVDIIILIASIIITFSLVYTTFDNYFKLPDDTYKIRIENTATKNTKSGGTDIRLRAVSVDDTVIPFEQLKFNSDEWVYLDELLISINPLEPVEIEYVADNAENLTVELQKHDGSGVVAIWVNDRRIAKLDLYSPTWEEIAFRDELGHVDVLSNIPMLLMLWMLSYVILKMWYSVYRYHISTKEKSLSLYIGSWIICGIVHIWLFGIHDSKGFLYTELVLMTIVAYIWQYSRLGKKIGKIALIIVTVAISAMMQFYIIELVNANIENLSINYVMGNVVLLLLIIWILYLLIRRVQIAVGIGMTVLSGFGIANYFVVQFRGSPIVPGDFFVINTAISVMDNYQFFVTKEIIFSAIMLVLWIGWLCFFSREMHIDTRKGILINVPGILCLFLGIINLDFFKPTLDLWNLNNSVENYGVTMTFVSGIRQMKRDEPSDYSRNDLETLVDDYVNKEKQEIEPNIIVVMNEAFSDLSVLDDRLDNDVYMSYFKSLENAVKGTALVSTIGGGTANTEYEFLTSNTMGFLPNTVPYQQYIHRDTYSFANTLKNLGYHTIALHPYDKMGYSRYRVYPYLGFEEFIDESDFENPELARDIYITDEESYEKIIELFKEKQDLNKPLFVFNVTMQNHGGYETGFYKDDVISIPGYEGRYKDVEEYLTLVKQSDEALDVLIDYFSKCEEPTIVAVFGDHQPLIKDPYYEDATGLESSQWSLEDIQKRYMVPFIIWANYDIPDEEDVQISINYLSGMISEIAEIPTTPYQEFLLDMQQEIPAMNVIGYQTKDNNWHFHSDENDSAYLNTYWDLQYNYMFDNKKIEEWFVVE